MMNILKDISNKLEPNIVEVLCDIDTVCKSHSIPFLVVGATARDIIFNALFNIKTSRASLDIDFGIRVQSWNDFETVITDLIRTGKYQRDANQLQRLRTSNTIVDIVPFGDIEIPKGAITWPSKNDIIMSTVGFNDALEHSIDVLVSNSPEIIIKVSSIPGLAIMKVIAWNDKYPNRKKDAVDFLFMLTNYINAGNEMRLYDSDGDLSTAQLDYDLASARILGRDSGKICSEEAFRLVNGILEREFEIDSQFKLVGDMTGDRMYDDTLPSKILDLLKQFHLGLNEKRN
jgi:predicted nucleotidyltransferase